MGISWEWRFEDGDGEELAPETVSPPPAALEAAGPALTEGGTEGGFESQGAAETWIGLVWRTLFDTGVAQVTLLEEGRKVYGPMNLAPQALPLAPAREHSVVPGVSPEEAGPAHSEEVVQKATVS